MAAIWPQFLTEWVRDGTWSNLTDPERAVLVVYAICADATGRSWWDKAKLAKLAGLSARAVQVANQRLGERGLIRREWDGNFTHAAITTLLPPSSIPETPSAQPGATLAHEPALPPAIPSAPPSARVAHHHALPQRTTVRHPSAPGGRTLAHSRAPQPYQGTITQQPLGAHPRALAPTPTLAHPAALPPTTPAETAEQYRERCEIAGFLATRCKIWRTRVEELSGILTSLDQAKALWREVVNDRGVQPSQRPAAMAHRITQLGKPLTLTPSAETPGAETPAAEAG